MKTKIYVTPKKNKIVHMTNTTIKAVGLLFSSTFLYGCLHAQNYTLSSPQSILDEKEIAAGVLRLNVEILKDDIRYAVEYKGQPAILASPLGMVVDNQNIASDVTILNVKDTQHDETYKSRGNHEFNRDHYIGKTFELKHNPTGQVFYLDTRVYPNGIAIRYRLEAKESRAIYDDKTTFQFPQGTKVWYSSGPFQYDWLQQYQHRDLAKIEGELLAPPPTFLLPNGVYASITESNLFNFHGAVLFGTKANQVKFGFVENKGHVVTGAKIGLPSSQYWHEKVTGLPWIAKPNTDSNEIVSPWRVLTISSDLNGLVNNDMVSNVADKPDPKLFPKGMETEWIHPSRSIFTWLREGGEERLSVETHKKYIDDSPALNIKSLVIDDGWEKWGSEKGSTKNKWQLLQEVTDYATAKGIDIWVWRPVAPRYGNGSDIGLNLPSERRAFMRKCAEIGVKGLKIDFFHTENEYTVNLMEDILKDAAKEKLMVIFHGVNKPTGDSRTYPNLLAKEAVRGLETVGGENSWAPGPPWPYHNTVIPFTRWLAGPADYTLLNFRAFWPGGTSYAHQLASMYIMTSPFLMFAADIEDLQSSPARSFIESVPVEWDKTIVLPQSTIGELAAFARRKDDLWYLSVLHGEGVRSETFSLDFLPKGKYKMELIQDNIDDAKKIIIKTSVVTSKSNIKYDFISGGGLVARFIRQ
ncbi:glycoside hydrolase family 97 protein [Sphingobacterium kitahiroshimense]|uniref:Glycoside hydrolase family 97 catalytic domain-containing protein n=1 Tax=Sphingobacterium kitahiroshimense TaxID=470446 RepID=A0ABV0BST6_9SPHI